MCIRDRHQIDVHGAGDTAGDPAQPAVDGADDRQPVDEAQHGDQHTHQHPQQGKDLSLIHISKYYGRFNQGVVTINLVDVALSSGGNFDKFWKIFDERLALCHRALQARHKRLLGTPSDAAPILWQYGALARLKKGEKIDKLLFGGYSTISLGYAGLYECVKYMTGKSHTDAGAKPFALSVMQHMNDKCNEWKKAENMDYSLYGTPLESTTYKFAKCLQKRFGIVPGITDKNYITNSYHVHVSEHIDAFTKLKFESEFQKLSPGGAISYVEVPNMQEMCIRDRLNNHCLHFFVDSKSLKRIVVKPSTY